MADNFASHEKAIRLDAIKRKLEMAIKDNDEAMRDALRIRDMLIFKGYDHAILALRLASCFEYPELDV